MITARSGMTLLEAMVGLVILGTVGVALLEVFSGATRVAVRAENWSRAVAHAENAVESFKLDPRDAPGGAETLADGFTRRVSVEPWSDPAFATITVEVTIPGGGTHTLRRLWRAP